MVLQFNETYKPKDLNTSPPVIPTKEQQATWGNLIVEELQELAIAFEKEDVVEVMDAVADIIYVTAQQAHLYGYPVDAALREVHSSNMSKLDDKGNPIIREDGKVLKGPNFREPNLAKVMGM